MNYQITGDITVSIIVAATMDYTLHASIVGAITVPITVAAVMDYKPWRDFGLFDTTLFDRGLFDEPGSAVSVADTTTSGLLGLIQQLSGVSDASLVLTAGNLTKVGFPGVGAKELRQMPWSRLP